MSVVADSGRMRASRPPPPRPSGPSKLVAAQPAASKTACAESADSTSVPRGEGDMVSGVSQVAGTPAASNSRRPPPRPTPPSRPAPPARPISKTVSVAACPQSVPARRSITPPKPPMNRSTTLGVLPRTPSQETSSLSRSATEVRRKQPPPRPEPLAVNPHDLPSKSLIPDFSVPEEETPAAPSRPAPISPVKSKRTPNNPVYTASIDYEGLSGSELSFAAGEAIMLLEEEANENGWVLGMSEGGEEGYLPITYIRD